MKSPNKSEQSTISRVLHQAPPRSATYVSLAVLAETTTSAPFPPSPQRAVFWRVWDRCGKVTGAPWTGYIKYTIT